jgi:3-methyladenine DNA glycosylase/8-oxoguanine DNA glycosylase
VSAAGPPAGPPSGPPAGSADGDAGLGTVWRPGRPVDLAGTLAPLSHGPADPTCRRDRRGVWWLTALCPPGPATLALWRHGSEVHAAAWGDGAEWLVAGVPDLLGAADDVSGFAPRHPVLRDAWRRHSGVRLTRTGLVWGALVPAVLEQKVAGAEAWRSWRELLWRFGGPAPGPAPAGMRVVPSPAVLRDLPVWEWHRAGVDARRRGTLRAAAGVADRLAGAAAMPGDAARARLRAVPGVGPWTAAEVLQRASGDADAVSVGDYHIPSLVGRALVGTPLDDAGMLEVLEEYRPHRHRVVQLLRLGAPGIVPAPRRAPRARLRDYRAI